MTILLTGATGFIGRHVLALLLERGESVVAPVRPASASKLRKHERLRVLPVEAMEVPESELKKVDALIHLAAHGVVDGLNEWEGCFRVNVHESLNLWRRAAQAGVRRFVICGSCFEYGRSGERYEFIPVDAPLEPTNAYGASKAAATMAALALAEEYKLELVVARPFHVFGEGEDERRFWPSLRRAAISGANFEMSPGKQIRDFTPVVDVASSFVKLVTDQNAVYSSYRVVNLGNGNPVPLACFAKAWWRKLEARGELLTGAIPMRKNEVMRYVPKITPI